MKRLPDRLLASAGAERICALLLRLPIPSPVLDESRTPMGPEILPRVPALRLGSAPGVFVVLTTIPCALAQWNNNSLSSKSCLSEPKPLSHNPAYKLLTHHRAGFTPPRVNNLGPRTRLLVKNEAARQHRGDEVPPNAASSPEAFAHTMQRNHHSRAS